MKNTRSESSVQFDEIWKEHHDPEMKEKRKIVEQRKKRQEVNRIDFGL